jgi:hypothetical protein
MTESRNEGFSGTWAPAQCPFRVAYSLRTLDDIRLAVVDAFFSVPHGGVEIGGILLGSRNSLETTILDCVPLDCEHAFGPSFTLSPRDFARLSALLEETGKNPPDLQPIGWYHSHTRSGIFLSDVDLELHKRYFPAPWHIALVLKPHTFQPTRAGFFFREPDGSFHAQASYLEFILEPLPQLSVPASAVPPPGAATSVRPDSPPPARVIAMPQAAAAGFQPALQSVAADSPEPEFALYPPPSQPPRSDPAASAPAVRPPTPPAPVALAATPPPPAVQPPTQPAPAAKPPTPPVPVLAPASSPRPPADEPTLHFLDLDPPRRWRDLSLLWVAICLVITAVAIETRQTWLPRLASLPQFGHRANTSPAKVPIATSLGLTLADHSGDLNIAWDHQAAAVLAGTGGTVEISSGGGIPMATRLDATQLHSGSLTFKRETEKVDVTLSVDGSHGELGRETRGFFGKLPETSADNDDSPAARQRDVLAAEVERLKGEIKAQTASNRELQQSLDRSGTSAADFDRLKSQLTAQTARSRELEKAVRAKDDQIAKLRNDLSVQQSHAKVLAKSVDDLQLRLQQMKRLSNQNADPSRP